MAFPDRRGLTLTSSLRRALLASIISLGGIVSAVSATGVLAPTTDTAKTGVSEKELVQTGVFPAVVNVDLQLGADGCAGWQENLATPIVTLIGITTVSFSSTNNVCIRNIGTTATRLQLRVLPGSVDFIDDACTPGETVADPQGCTVDRLSAKTNFAAPTSTTAGCPAFDQSVGTPSIAGTRVYSTTATLATNIACDYSIIVSNGSPLTVADQTDSVRWQFEFLTL